MSSTNLVTQITCSSNIEELKGSEFTCCVSGLAFVKTIETLSAGDVSLEIKERKNRTKYMFIKHKRNKYSIDVTDHSEFPMIKLNDDSKVLGEFLCSSKSLIKSFKRASSVISLDDQRPSLSAVNLIVDDNRLSVLGLSQGISVRQDIELENSNNFSDILIEKHIASYLSNIDSEGFIRVRTDGKYVNFQGGGVSISSLCKEYNGASLRTPLRFWDDKPKEYFTVPRKEFSDCLTRCSVYTLEAEKSSLVILSIEDNDFVIRRDVSERNLHLEEFLDVNNRGVEDFFLGIFERQFNQTLGMLDCENTLVRFSDNRSPVFVEPFEVETGYKQSWIVMPVMIDGHIESIKKRKEEEIEKIEKKGARK